MFLGNTAHRWKTRGGYFPPTGPGRRGKRPALASSWAKPVVMAATGPVALPERPRHAGLRAHSRALRQGSSRRQPTGSVAQNRPFRHSGPSPIRPPVPVGRPGRSPSPTAKGGWFIFCTCHGFGAWPTASAPLGSWLPPVGIRSRRIAMARWPYRCDETTCCRYKVPVRSEGLGGRHHGASRRGGPFRGYRLPRALRGEFGARV